MARYKEYRTRRYGKRTNKRIGSLHKSKSILKKRIFRDVVLISILIIELLYALFFSQIFKIKDITIVSPKEILKQELQVFLQNELQNKAFYFFEKDNIFLASIGKIKNGILDKYPEIKEVELRREFPKGLFLKVEKREPFGILNSSGNNFLIDEEGIVFKEVSEDFEKETLAFILIEHKQVKLGEGIIRLEIMQKISLIKEELEENVNIFLESFYLNENRLNIKTLEGWEIYFNISQNTEEIRFALTKIGVFLEKEVDEEERKNLEYIDLRFSKVYYK